MKKFYIIFRNKFGPFNFPGIRQRGHKQSNEVYFDTLHVVPLSEHDAGAIKVRAQEKKVNLRYFDDGAVGVALDETTTKQDVDDLLWIFDCKSVEEVIFNIYISRCYSIKRTRPGLKDNTSNFRLDV